MLGSMSRAIGGQGRRAMSGSALTRGGMYNWRVAAILNALERAGKAEGPLEIADLTALGHLDQYHYLGTAACDEAAGLLGIGPEARVLDVGSGIGGPARYLAHTTGCSVTGVELQADLADAATELTSRVVGGLGERVRFATGDFVSDDLGLPVDGYDHLLSLLVFLHVPDRRALLAKCHAHLRPGGTFLIEDFSARAPFSSEESSILRDLVKAPTVTSSSEYVRALKDAGFVDVEVDDLTDTWRKWTAARHRLYVESEAETVALHGRELYESRVHFYRAIDQLFDGGNLGGVRITGRRPSAAEVALTSGRRDHAARAPSASTVHVVEGSAGDVSTADMVVPTRTQAEHVPQPRFPAAEGVHDSLQYHFFLPAAFIAVRIFGTPTLHHASAWVHNLESGASATLFDDYTPMTTPAGAPLALGSPSFDLVDAGDRGELKLYAQTEEAKEVLSAAHMPSDDRGVHVAIKFGPRRTFAWLPSGQEESQRPVIHRPELAVSATWNGAEVTGHGYSKRYWGEYGRYWGYRFIHGLGLPAENSPSAESANARDAAASVARADAPAVVWTADATFGEAKYNYYKLLPPPPATGMVEALSEETYNQAHMRMMGCACASCDAGVRSFTRSHAIAPRRRTLVTRTSAACATLQSLAPRSRDGPSSSRRAEVARWMGRCRWSLDSRTGCAT